MRNVAVLHCVARSLTRLVAAACDVLYLQRLPHRHCHCVPWPWQAGLERHHSRHVAVDEGQDDGVSAGGSSCCRAKQHITAQSSDVQPLKQFGNETPRFAHVVDQQPSECLKPLARTLLHPEH